MNRITFGVLAIIVLLTSCGKDSVEEPLLGDSGNNSNDGEVEVRFSSGITTSVSVTEAYDTRGVITGALPGNDIVGIFGIQAQTGKDTTSYNMKNTLVTFQENLVNTAYTVLPDDPDIYGNQTLFNDKKAKFPKGNNMALAFYAYYPYTSNVTRQEELGMSIPWTLNKEDMSKTKDYMYTGQIFSGVSKIPINLKLKHAMARIDFTFYTNDQGVMLMAPNLIKVEIDAFGAEAGWMSLDDGEINYDNSNITYVYPMEPKLIGINNKAVYASFLLPPSVAVSDIRYTVTNKVGEVTVYDVYSYANGDPGIDLEAGKTTKINVNYFPKEANFQSSVKAWETLKSYDIKMKLK